jgi:hypothetical protein
MTRFAYKHNHQTPRHVSIEEKDNTIPFAVRSPWPRTHVCRRVQPNQISNPSLVQPLENLSLSDRKLRAASLNPSDFTKPFLDFMTNNPTVFHAVDYFSKKLEAKGFTKLSERANWEGKLKKGGRYYTTRNGSSLMAFVVGEKYKAGNGASIVVGHIDALAARRKLCAIRLRRS